MTLTSPTPPPQGCVCTTESILCVQVSQNPVCAAESILCAQVRRLPAGNGSTLSLKPPGVFILQMPVCFS